MKTPEQLSEIAAALATLAPVLGVEALIVVAVSGAEVAVGSMSIKAIDKPGLFASASACLLEHAQHPGVDVMARGRSS